jgi:hypothetical protein
MRILKADQHTPLKASSKDDTSSIRIVPMQGVKLDSKAMWQGYGDFWPEGEVIELW